MDKFTAHTVHAALNDATRIFQEVGSMTDADDVSSDTWLSIGYAMGSLGRAISLVARDMDDAAREVP